MKEYYTNNKSPIKQAKTSIKDAKKLSRNQRYEENKDDKKLTWKQHYEKK